MKVQKVMILIFLLLSAGNIFAQGELKDYQEAEKWLYNNSRAKIYNAEIQANWIGQGDSLWYTTKTRKGKEYFLVNVNQKQKTPLFNHEKLAAQITKALNKEYKAYDLNLTHIKLKGKDTLNFALDTSYFKISLRDYKIQKTDRPEKRKPAELSAPNTKRIAFIKDYNIYLKDKDGSNEVQLSKDGCETLSYGNSIPWEFVRNENNKQDVEYEISAYWSPDSKYLICGKYNRKEAQNLYMYNCAPEKGLRAEVYSYERALAGDTCLAQTSYVIFNAESGKQIECDLPKNASFLEGGFEWKSNTHAYTIRYQRGYQTRELIDVDVETGKTRTVISETANTYVDVNMLLYKITTSSNNIIWSSEKDGWNQLYVYDYETGKQKNKITKGEYVVREICKVDEKKGKLYFTACGLEKGDPYYTYLYSINIDGSGLKLLSPENATHSCTISPNGKYVFDDYSRVDLPNHFLIRKAKNGNEILDIAQLDIDDILAMGWKAPEMYTLKARDNKTDIYGVIYRPFKMDSTKKYPIIDGTYSGPQTIRTPKSFTRALYSMDVSISQIGFVVITVDGLGSAYRSKKFHDVSYKNLGDIGAPDHIKAITEIADKYSYMDINSVGIYGHSAGGYDAAHALLTHPDFYKVGVASAGNHDHRIAKAWWPELYMGFPAGKHYDEQSNLFLADQLQGKLMLAHGNMDNNVNAASSMRMADALIKANKDFELLLVPGCDHSSLYYNKYFIRKRWDFFVQNLWHKVAPNSYEIKN
ncbi:MAG: DPP IV N-terminal domain-containing protein [Labilibaculum antarcticum]